ncbi:MAG: penicillin-binding transpeptidase domain-containing protein [Sandaracinaceae bacterium]
MLRDPRTYWRAGIAVALVGAAIGFASGPGGAQELAALTKSPPLRRERAQDSGRGRTFLGFDPRRHRRADAVMVSDLADGSTAVLSLDPGLQEHVSGMFARYEVPYGALIALEPSSGRVLAYVSHSSAEPDGPDLVLDPSPPTASVFKIVTGAALVEAGVDPDAPVCYHGGLSRLTEGNLEDDPGRDRSCASLGEAMGGSINAVFAKLAVRHLDPSTLERAATRFGFGETLPFDVATRVSPREVPTERLEFARTAAGFWHMHMSPFHGALMAAAVASGGVMPRATIVDTVLDARGRVTYEAHPTPFRTVMEPEVASRVADMMRQTVAHGTARQYFFDGRGNPFLPGIDAAGKTGTLTGSDPYRGYTWFVGFAPVDDPQIAVAALVVNEPRWRIKGSFAAREAMRYWLVTRPALERREAREAERRMAEQAASDEASASPL